MKTFTTYAEKKAKQFFNLLQECTKGIRMTAILILLLMGVNNAWAATIFNCGIEVNETWYKGTGTINSGHWLEDKTDFSNKDFGVLTSIKLGGHYDTWDNNQEDYCGWNPNNGITITIKNGSTQKDQFRLSCFHSAKDGNNNIWETMGTINECSDEESSTYGRYTHDISKYTAGAYTIEAKWMSPSSQSTQATASFTIPGFTTTSKSQTFDNTTVGNNSSKTISFGTHYGTALQTSNCFFSGTNASEFSVTSIDESGVTVKFTPTSAGNKTATLTITDAHEKTCTITLSGDAQSPTPTITITSPKEYLKHGTDKITLNITYENIPTDAEYEYAVHVTDINQFLPEKSTSSAYNVISGSGSVEYTTNNDISARSTPYTVNVKLYKKPNRNTVITQSNDVTITVEQSWAVNLLVKTEGNLDNAGGTIVTNPAVVYATTHNKEQIEARPNPGYAFTGWTTNRTDAIFFDDASALCTNVSATVASGDAYANFTKETCVYFINAGDWSSVYVYAWNGNGETKNADWPGEAMTKTDETIGGYDVYKYCPIESYENIIFSQNGNNQTGNLKWEDGKYYGLEIKMHGDFFGSWQDTDPFAFSQSGTSASLTLNINAGDYEFGMKVPDWRSCNSISFTRNANSHSMTQDCGNNNNATFNADVTGEYTFTWTFATNTLTITYPTLSSYTVDFNMNGRGAAPESQTIEQGGKVTKPADPTAEGFTFGGWYTDAECTNPYDFNTIVSSNFTLYAKWIQQYVIVGNGKGSWLNGANWIESVIADASFNVTKQLNNIIDGSVTYSACPAGLKNFRIVPWGIWDILHGKDQLTSCNVPSYTNEDNNIAFVTVAEADITIGFDGTNITVQVDYDDEDLANVKAEVLADTKRMFYFGDEWIANDVPEDSYRYHKYVNEYGTTTHLVTETKGFKTNVGGTDKYLAVAILPAEQYSISNRYDWNGVSTGEVVQAGAIYAWFGNQEMGITPGVTPTWSNNTISVQLETAASGLSATVGNSSVGLAQTINYYYQLEGGNTWTKFDPNNVSALPVGIYKVHALAHDGNIYVRTAEPATLTIYKQYYVQFNANGGEGNMEKQSFVYGETQALSANQFTREGHAFLGWSTTQNGEVVYGDKAEVTNLTPTNNATVNLYAQWLSQTPTYTINFDKQNGTNGTSSATVQYQNNNYNPATVVAPTRTDYTFGGYYTQAEGAGVQVVSAAGEWLKSVTGYTDASGNWIKNSGVTLYAKWISNSTSTEGLPTGVYLVGEVFNNWSAAPNQEFKKATESSTVYSLVVNLAEKKGYKFKVIDNGNWRGNSLENEFLTETNTSVILYKDGANNAECKITTTEAGEYIFTWDSETNTLSVEYPSDRVTVTFFGDGGTVGAVADDRVLTSPAKVKPGTSVTFTATPDANNAFSQWKKNGAVVSTDPTYTCAIDADATIEAVFLKPTTVFLKPNAQWKSDEARFAIYYWKSEQDNGWVDLKQLTCHDEYYTADVPVGYSQLQFVRMKPNSTNTQSNVWNRTTDLTLPTNGNNLYDLTKIYLKPNAEWKRDGARFAAYFFHSDFAEDKAWMSMLPTNETGVYYCDVPTDKLYNKVSFVRMKGEPSTNEWGNRLNQSKDIDLYNGSNFYTLEEGKWGKGSDGGYIDDMNVIYSGKWTKLELPTITITNTTPDFGDVVVKTTGGRIITTGEKVPFDTKVIVTVTPKNGYKLQTATINGESLSVGTQNTICNNTTINVTFAIKEEWYVIGVDGDWETPQERFRFVDGQLEVELDSNVTANFKIAHMQGTSILTRYGNKSFSITERDQTLTSANGSGDHCNIATTYYGKYLFTWDARKMKLTITYPLSVGDYRLAYQDTQDNTLHVERVIKKCFTGDRLDTVSFFVRHNKQPKLVLQQCATLVDGVGTWQTKDDNIEFSVGKTGVWNFVLQQTNNPTHSVQVLTDDIKPYEGDYYIRTKSAKDGWTYFRSDSHKMTYSSYADNNEPFSHYFCKWVATDAEAANKTKNVRYTIANDYGDCISDTLAADPEDANPRIVTNANGDLPTNSANVRFGWDWETNEIRRAYLAGSTGDSENTYLRLADGVALKDANNVSQTAIRFNDTENWIYQLDVIATKSTKVNLTALYNGSLQYFKGGPTMTNEQDDRIGLLSDDASSDITFNIRLVYDFKTNHLIVAWVPDNGMYDGTLGANMMVIREHDYKNGEGTVAVTQLNLQNEGLTDVDTVYAVMTFTQNWINKDRTRDQSIYWVSFPFDVKLSDAFGFGEYADAWIIQYYDGAERAKKGLFSDSGTYWKYIFNPDGVVLKKGVGYVLVLDLDKIQFNHGVTSVSLYFPSSEGVKTISPDLPEGITVPAHKCEITTGSINHTITDSHWNLIGVPAFKDVTEFDVTQYHFAQDDASFYYKFLPNQSKYEVVNSSNTTFQAMYSYMVQFAGTINWRLKEVIFNENQQLAARRNADNTEPEKVSLRLEIAQDEVMADQTFVQLQQEGATAEFDMNLDLTKIINSGANIYTLAGEQRIQSAGNALPMGEVVVPVGVKIATEGEYTFRMPDGTEGMVVELIDYETNTRTNLLLDDYTITLSAGSYENRFALHIQPEKDVTTGVGNVGDETKGIEKYLIDGKLIIRTAEGIFDAQGHRL